MHRDAGVSAEPGFVLWSHGDRSRRHLGRSHGSRYAGRSRGGGGSVRVRKMLPMSVPWAARRLTAVRQASGPAGRSPRGVACRRRRVVQNSTRTGKLVTRYRSERARVTRVMYIKAETYTGGVATLTRGRPRRGSPTAVSRNPYAPLCGPSPAHRPVRQSAAPAPRAGAPGRGVASPRSSRTSPRCGGPGPRCDRLGRT
jgi:hypothetical protein